MFFKQKLKLISLFALLLFILFAFTSNPPNGRTGAPGDGVCTSCHGGSGGGFNGNITLAGLPSNIDGGDMVELTFTVNYTTGTPTRGGFQAVALRDDIDTNAGDFSNPGPFTNTNTASGTGREYVEHSPAQMFGGGSSVEYSIEWEAPNIDEDVTIYAASILGNGSGSGGDKFITAQFNTSVSSVTGPLDISITSSSDVTCFDGDDGTATATATGGVGPYEYEWENGETGPTAINLDEGIHDVTVTDDTGATASTSVNIDEPSEIELDITDTDISCFGDEDGSIVVDPSGGTGSYDCEFSNGLTGCTQNNLAAGTYFISVTDNNGCTVIGEAVINQPDELIINMSSTPESSPGANDGTATATPEGGTGTYQYDWSNGETNSGPTSTINGLEEGTYSVTVTDDNGCQAISSISVEGGDCNIAASEVISDVLCFGDNSGSIDITVTDGADPIQYNWSNGFSTEDLIDVPAGTYSVTIIDNGDCTIILNNLVVGQPTQLSYNVNEIINTECADDNTGSISLNISGGESPYLVEWSTGASLTTSELAVLDMLAPGEYGYTITDNNACVEIGSSEVLNDDDIDPTLVLMEGFIYIGENGTTDESTFDLVDGGSFDNCSIETISFPSEVYDCSQINVYEFSVSISDAAGNVTEGTAILNVVDTIPPTIDCSMNEDIVTSSCEPVDYEIPTATDNCNVAEIVLIEGFAPGSVFPSGTTTVTYEATDDCGWSSTCSFTVTVNIDLAIETSSTNVSCPNGNDGSLDFVFTGGTPPYSFILSPPVDDLNMVEAGTYTITVTDDANCVAISMVTITEPDAIDVTDIQITNSDPGDANGAIAITPEGGTPGYSFEWQDANGNVISTEEDINGLSVGVYTLVIVDSAGCISGTFSFTIDSTSSTVETEETQVLVNLGPNPASNYIHIMQKSIIFNKFEIYNTSGKLIDVQNINQAAIRYNVNELKSGIYILTFSNSESRVSKQFLKI